MVYLVNLYNDLSEGVRVITFPLISIERDISATWLSFPCSVKKGDKIIWSGITTTDNPAGGQFTINVAGSVSGTIVAEVTDISHHTYGNIIWNGTANNTENLQISSYVNTAAKAKAVCITIFRQRYFE